MKTTALKALEDRPDVRTARRFNVAKHPAARDLVAACLLLLVAFIAGLAGWSSLRSDASANPLHTSQLELAHHDTYSEVLLKTGSDDFHRIYLGMPQSFHEQDVTRSIMSESDKVTVTVSSVEELIEALGNAQGGETILLAAGNYGDLRLVQHQYEFLAFDSEVTIKSADLDSPAVFASLDLRGVKNLTFDSIKLDYEPEPGTPEYDIAFLIRDSEHVTVRNSVFDGALAEGLDELRDGYGTGHGLTARNSSNIIVENNEFHTWRKAAIFSGVDDLILTGNEFHSIRTDATNFVGVNNVLIEDNHMHSFAKGEEGDHRDMIQFWVMDNTDTSTNITIRGNVLDTGGGDSAQGIFMRNASGEADPTNLERFFQNIVIEDNVIHTGHTHGITVGETVGLVISNNTLVANYDTLEFQNSPTINVRDASQDVIISNNVVPRLSIDPTSDRIVENNLVVQTADPLGENYVGDLFVNALAGKLATLYDLQALPDGLIEKLGVGASLTRFNTTPENPAGFIANAAGDGLDLLAHTLDASNIFGPDGRMDLTGATVTWDFGDGNSGTGLTPGYTWQNAGSYNVTADVTLATGETVSLNKMVMVQTPLAIHAEFNGSAEDLSDSVNNVVVGSEVTFEGSGDDLALRLNGGKVAYERSPELLNNTEYTLVADFKKDQGSEASDGLLIYFSSSFIVTIGADSLDARVITDYGTNAIRPNSVGINDAEWHRLALTFSGEDGNAILYLDGVEVGRVTGLEGAVQAGSRFHDLHFGNPFDGTKSFPGLIDNFQFWTGAMSAEQIEALSVRAEDGKFVPLEGTKTVTVEDTVTDPVEDTVTDPVEDEQTDPVEDDPVDEGETEPVDDTAGEDDSAHDFDETEFDQVIIGSEGDDNLNGGHGADYMYGGGGDNTLRGRAGDDVLVGGAGTDKLLGGHGDDILIGGTGLDIMTGGQGNDTFMFLDIATTRPGGAERARIHDFTPGEDKIDISAIDAIAGGDNDDFTFIGTAEFTAAGQLRQFDFGRGIIVEGDVNGDGQADFQIALLTNNLVLTADDFVGVKQEAQASDVQAVLASGVDETEFDQVIIGSDGDDDLWGDEGADYIYGGGGDNVLRGRGGDDVLVGGEGLDKLLGGAGDDVLIGGTGLDIMTGGPGNDTFKFTDIATTAPGGAERARITDFTPGEDKIDVSAIDAIAGGDNDAFTFIGTADFSAAGQLRQFDFARGVIVEGDVTGDGQADFQIALLSPGLVLTADDFTL